MYCWTKEGVRGEGIEAVRGEGGGKEGRTRAIAERIMLYLVLT